jgi:hypothetical protein
VSKIKRYANFAIKNAMVFNISIPFVFFTNNFVNSPKKRPEKLSKNMKIALEYLFAILQKNGLWYFFLELNIESRKNIYFGQIQNLSPTWHMDTPLKIKHFKIDLKKTFIGHIDFIPEIESSNLVGAVYENLKTIKNTLFEISAVEWKLFWKNTLRLCSKIRMKMDSNLFETIKNGKFG